MPEKIDTIARYRRAVRRARTVNVRAVLGEHEAYVRISKREALEFVRRAPPGATARDLDVPLLAHWLDGDPAAGSLFVG